MLQPCHKILGPSRYLESSPRGTTSRFRILEPGNYRRRLLQRTVLRVDTQPTARLDEAVHTPTVVADRKVEGRQLVTCYVARNKHREDHLVGLPSPTSLETAGEYPYELHSHCGSAFALPAAIGPPHCAAQRKWVHTRMKSDPVIFTHHEKTAHVPVRSDFGGRESGSCCVDLVSQRFPLSAAKHAISVAKSRQHDSLGIYD